MEEGSAETVNAELNIFDSLPYQVSHIKGDWVRIVMKNSAFGTNHDTPITFEITKTPGVYLDLASSYFVCEVSITNLKEDATVKPGAFINNVFNSLFKDVNISFNGTKIEGENLQYSLKSYIFNSINSSHAAKEHQL